MKNKLSKMAQLLPEASCEDCEFLCEGDILVCRELHGLITEMFRTDKSAEELLDNFFHNPVSLQTPEGV